MHLTNSEKNLPTAVNRRYHRSVNGNDGKRETFGSLSVHLTQNGQCKITLCCKENIFNLGGKKPAMQVLVTGADGMLGSQVVRLLIARGVEVHVLIHPSSRASSLGGLPIRRFYGDILVPESLDRAFSGADMVVHAAASTAIWPARSEVVRKINVEGTLNVIGQVLNHGVRRMVYVGSASSVNTAGSPTGNQRFPGARFGLDYIDSKYEALNLVLEAVKSRGLPALAILPTFMIGPWDTVPGSGKMILTLAEGRLKFYTKGGRNYIYAGDVAAAIVNSLEQGEIGEYYVAGNENLTYHDFFMKVAGIVHRRPPRISVPCWMVKAAGMAGDLYGRLTGKPPMISYPMALISCEKQYVSSEKAVRELSMPQTSIDTAINECYKWFIQSGYLKTKQ
jgi:dihydroflavonol-4-reductase